MRTVILFATIIGCYCYSVNRMDNSEMDSEGLVRLARSASSSSSEDDKKKDSATKDLNKIVPGKNSEEVEGSGEGSGQREVRQIQIAEPLEEGSGALYSPNSETHNINTRQASSESSEEKTAVEGSGETTFSARLADSPIEIAAEEGSGQENTFSSTGSGKETGDARATREVEGSGLDQAEESSGDGQTSRTSRNADQEGELLASQKVRMVEEGSGEAE